MAFFDKLKWILGITLIFALIATTNLLDRNNFVQVKESVASIYEDRLIAKDIILDMYKAVHEKKMAIVVNDTDFLSERRSAVNNDLNALMERFEGTKLTNDEARVFENLKSNIVALFEREEDIPENDFGDADALLVRINQIESNLDDLSDIQISEGLRQLSITERATDSIELFTQLEIYVLIFLAIVIQVIILYQPKKA